MGKSANLSKSKRRPRGQPPKGPGGARVSTYPPLTVRIPEATKRKLEALSALRQLPMWVLVNNAIRDYIARLPPVERRSVERSGGKRGLRQFDVPGRTALEPQPARIITIKETPQMATQQIVVIPMKCEKCGGQIEIHCQHSPGFGYVGFYAVECPHCRARLHPQLPGDIVDVLAVGTTAAE